MNCQRARGDERSTDVRVEEGEFIHGGNRRGWRKKPIVDEETEAPKKERRNSKKGREERRGREEKQNLERIGRRELSSKKEGSKEYENAGTNDPLRRKRRIRPPQSPVIARTMHEGGLARVLVAQ